MDGIEFITNKDAHTVDDSEIRDDFIDMVLNNPIFGYYYNVQTGRKMVRIFTDDVNEESIKEFYKAKSYREALCVYIKWYVHPDDVKKIQEMAVDIPVYEYIKDKPETTLYYRHKYSVGYLYNKLSVHKLLGEDGKLLKVLMLCQQADKEIRKELEEIEARKQYSMVLSAVAKEYSSLYYVDLKRGIHTVYNISDRMEGMFGDYFYKTSYEAAVSAYIASAVAQKDKEFVARILDREYLIRQTKIREYFIETYLNNDGKYCEMKCVRVPSPNGGYDLVMGFAVKDEQIRKEAENRKKILDQLSILEGLSQEYSSVWIISPENRTYRPSKYHNKIDDDAFPSRQDSFNYDAGMAEYIEKKVAREDAARVRCVTDFETVLEALEKKKTYSVTYKGYGENEEIIFNQMCFGLTQIEGGDRQIVLAFRNIDQMITDELNAREALTMAINQRDIDGLTGMRNRLCFERRRWEYQRLGAHTISCVYVDLDGLHILNEKEGHKAGDEALKMVARKLCDQWRKEDIYRVDGDEFVVIVPDVDSDITLSRIDALKAAIEKEGYHISVGFSITNGSQADMVSLLENAKSYMLEERKRYQELMNQGDKATLKQ